MEKRYIARRVLRSEHPLATNGYIDGGQEYPAEEVTHALLSLGWVQEDVHGELDGTPAKPAAPAKAPKTKKARAPKPAKPAAPAKA